MTKYPCPTCGAEIVFRTSITSYAVCPYCRTMVVRQDEGIRNIGTMAALPDDMSPFQIGTEGYYKGVHFGIVGRMKMGWEDGNWNEWFIVADNGRRGWLAEAQGFYAPCYDITEGFDWASLGMPVKDLAQGSSLGKEVAFNRTTYKIVDIKEAVCIGSEGELPFQAPQGRKTESIDLVHDNGMFGSIEISSDGMHAFEGSYVEWADLRCSNVRKLEGW